MDDVEHVAVEACPYCDGEGGHDMGAMPGSSCGERLEARCYYCAGTGWAVCEVHEQDMDDCDPWPPTDAAGVELLRQYEAQHE